MSEDCIVLRSAFYAKYHCLPEGARATVGRAEDADIHLLEVGLSRHHCVLERRGGRVFVEDLNSSNGTFVNGSNISRCQLTDGDCLRLGAVEFRFAHEESSEKSRSNYASSMVGMESGELRDNLRLLIGTVQTLVGAVEAKDRYTSGHSQRVTSYSLQLGRVLGMADVDLNVLELAGLLHDIGKIGVPDNVLQKPGKLTAEEYAIVKEHPRIGYRILCRISGAKKVTEAVLHHHERWDGKGYPEGLAGEDISLAARILSVSDAFDAMGSVRPYRRALGVEAIIEEIVSGCGSQFDPKVAQCMVEEIRSGHIAREQDWALRATIVGQAIP